MRILFTKKNEYGMPYGLAMYEIGTVSLVCSKVSLIRKFTWFYMVSFSFRYQNSLEPSRKRVTVVIVRDCLH